MKNYLTKPPEGGNLALIVMGMAWQPKAEVTVTLPLQSGSREK